MSDTTTREDTGGGGAAKPIAFVGAGAGAAALAAVVLVVLFLTSMGGRSVEDVAQDYLRAQYTGNLETVCELSTRDAQVALFERLDSSDCRGAERALKADLLDTTREQLAELAADSEAGFEFLEVTKEGDWAELEYRQRVTYDGDAAITEDFFEGGGPDKFTGLVKMAEEDGQWKVSEVTGGYFLVA